MSSFKKPFGYWRAKRIKIVGHFVIPQVTLDNFFRANRFNTPNIFLAETNQLKEKLDNLKGRNLEITVFKISPTVTCPGVASELAFREKCSASVAELLLLSDLRVELKGRVVASVSSQWKVAGGHAVSYFGLDFRHGKVELKTFAADVIRPRRMCFAYTSF